MTAKTPSRSSSRRALAVLASAACGVALLLPGDASTGVIPTPSPDACAVAPITLGDTSINPPTGGDNDFFAVPSGPPNIMFLVGNNLTLQEYVTPLPAPPVTMATPNGSPGCTDADPTLNPITNGNFYDPLSPDPKHNGTVPYDDDPDFGGGTKFFDPNTYYLSLQNRLQYEFTDGPPYTVRGSYQRLNGGDATSMCNSWGGMSGADKATCLACLTLKGWYRYTSQMHTNPYDYFGPLVLQVQYVLKGSVLNVLPPKFVVTRKVVKDVIKQVANVRIGMAEFGPDRGYYDPPNLLSPVKPACDKSFPLLDQTDLDTARTDINHKVNQLYFNNRERSIGEALFGLGGYFSSQQVDNRWGKWFDNFIPDTKYDWYPTSYNNIWENSVWGDGTNTWTKAGSPFELGGQEKSVCWGCQSTAVIVVTDGIPLNDNSVPVVQMLNILIAKGARHPDGSLLYFKPGTLMVPSADPGGVNYCDKYGGTKLGCDKNDAGPLGHDPTHENFMQDVAFFMAHMDLRDDYGGQEGVDSGQRMKTYTVGFGDNSPMLKSIAAAGNGKFYGASNGDELRVAILSAVSDAKETSTSFSSANLVPVQAGGQQFSAYLPRFTPRKDRPYEGHLFSFQYYSEFVAGCDPVAAAAGTDAADLDKDGTCDGIFLLDKPSGYVLTPGVTPAANTFNKMNIVQENKDGVFVKVKTATVDGSGKLAGGTPAEPFWDANDVLSTRSAYDDCTSSTSGAVGKGRCIYTVVDQDGDGRLTAADLPRIEFSRTNVDTLMPYLLAGGDDFCSDIFLKRGWSYSGNAADRKKCASTLIDFIRGVDVFDYDSDNDYKENRPCFGDSSKSCMLGDIFHSSPILVNPPVDPFVCDLGLNNQCLSTLYADYSLSGQAPSEPPCSTSTKPNCYTATPMNPALNTPGKPFGAYGDFLTVTGSRDRFILAGANDGMLHAFHVGTVTSKVKQSVVDDIYDLGTGQEIWAFVPPDLLPKLGMLVKGHQYMVDGTPMVRDIWADATGGVMNKKEANEFHTVAVVSERGGGTRYMGLDVTDPYAMINTNAKTFLWMWPNTTDTAAAQVGESWQNFAPKPPPIGPVRIESATDLTRGWEERWIVMLNGGYSSDLTRGRGVYMLDVWTGAELWNFAADVKPGGATGPYADMRNQMLPVPAAVAMVDTGKASSVQIDADGFFDTATVGDVGGQVWTFRFFKPGHPDSTNGGRMDNWFGGRGLEIDRQDVSSGAARDFSKREPFFNITSNALQTETGWVRTFIGTGDRQNLRDTEAAGCSPSNLLDCIRLKCTGQVVVDTTMNGYSVRNKLQFTAGNVTYTPLAPPTASAASPSATSCVAGSQLNVSTFALSCPNTTSLATKSWTAPAITDSSVCTTGGGYSCTTVSSDMNAKGDLAPNTTNMPKNGFYSFYSYGGTDRVFADQAGAVAYDGNRVSDKAVTCSVASGCMLKDVSIPSSARVTVTVGSATYQVFKPNYVFPKASAEGPGWYMKYEPLDEKSGAGSTVLGGIVFWPSLVAPNLSSGACAINQGDTARSWQADMVTGAPDQADSFKIYNTNGTLAGYQQSKDRLVSAPPPEPANIISLSKNGQIRYGIAVMEAGSKPSEETLRSKSDLAADLYWLEIPRSVHQCRHQDSSACN